MVVPSGLGLPVERELPDERYSRQRCGGCEQLATGQA